MNFYYLSFLSFSIFIPGIMAVLFFRKIGHCYYPFLACLWIGCFNEALSFVLIMQGKQTLVNNNIYVLLESLLLCWFLWRASLITSKPLFRGLLLLFIASWVAETAVFSRIQDNSTYFRIIYSLALVLISIHGINSILLHYHRSLIRNPKFVLCCAFIIYFTYKAFILAIVTYGWTRDPDLLVNLYVIMIYLNLGVNLLYALAVLWMTKKPAYTPQLSSHYR